MPTRPPTNDPLARRELLRVASLAALTTGTAAGCDLFSTAPSSSDTGNTGRDSVSQQTEAPSLEKLVSKGKLPKLRDRIPKNPVVIKPIDQPGNYGGTWRSGVLGTDQHWLGLTIAYENLLRWNMGWKKIVPNVAESFSVEDGGRQFVFKLRPGLKWSDGEPFDADDIMFWYENVLSNKELRPVTPDHLEINGEPVVVKRINDYEVHFAFTAPNGLFLPWMASIQPETIYPRHYLKKFHPDFNSSAKGMAKQKGFEDWVSMFGAMNDAWGNPERPRLHAWLPKAPFGSSPRFVAERNPYYFKVDTEGRQLPYLDTVAFQRFNTEQPMILAAAHGDLDLQSHYIDLPKNKPVLARSRKSGGYHFQDLKSSWMNWTVLTVNLNHKNPMMRAAFQNKNFRIGLSHAINRDEIVKAVFQQQGEPWQAAPRPETPFGDPELGKKYTKYDQALANSYLDRAGYAKRNSDGIRVLPDGNPISFRMMAMQRWTHIPDTIELVSKYWARVGIDMRLQTVQSSLYTNRYLANEHDAAADVGQYGYKDGLLDPRWYFPAIKWGAFYAPMWYRWYVGEGGEKQVPPASMRHAMKLYREKVVPEIDRKKQYEAMGEIVNTAINELWVIGTVLPKEGYGIVKNDFHNTPKHAWKSYMFPTPAGSHPEQYFTSGGSTGTGGS